MGPTGPNRNQLGSPLTTGKGACSEDGKPLASSYLWRQRRFRTDLIGHHTGDDPVEDPSSSGTVRGFVAAVRESARVVDLVALVAVPILLVALFALPRQVRLDLALAYRNPTLLTAFTSHYVHLEVTHLLANLLAYGAVVPVAYVVGVLSGRRKTFLAAFATFVVAFPFVLSGLNLLFPRPRVGYGFSGIAMAFVGVLAVLLWEYLAVQFGETLDRDRSPVLFFLGVGIIAMRTLPSTRAGLAVVVLAVVGSLLYLRPREADVIDGVLETVRRGARYPGHFHSAVWGVLIVVAIPFVAFHSSPAGAGTVLNVYSHALGYCLGYLVPYCALRVVGIPIE